MDFFGDSSWDATDYPDIDYDVAEPMELKEMLMDDWGKNSVVPICPEHAAVEVANQGYF